MRKYSSIIMIALLSVFIILFFKSSYSISNLITDRATHPENIQCKETHYLYAAHPQAGKITIHQIDPATGNLIYKSYIDTVAGPGDLVIQHNKDLNSYFLYTFGNYDGTIRVYSIKSDGNLKLVQNLTYILGYYAFNLAFDNNGDYMYISDTNRDQIAMFKVDKRNGYLTQLTPQIIPSHSPGGISMNPNSPKFVYITDYFSQGRIDVYLVDILSHTLIPLNKSYDTGAYPRLAWFDTKNHAYVLNLQSKDISMFHANTKTGRLTPLTIPTVQAGAEPITFALSPSEKYVYVGNRRSSDIFVYAKRSDGVLTKIESISTIESTTHGGGGARNIAIDTFNNTTYLYISNSYGNTIARFKLNSNELIEPSSITINNTKFMSPEVLGIARFKTCN
ncbi:MAG: lactonase family protein [Neisseriaceae bacterium]